MPSQPRHLDALESPAGWALWDDRDAGDLAARLRVDAELLRQVQQGARPATARVWQPGRGIAATRSDTRLPRFEAARASLASAGWPVVVRESGGGAVPHDAGVLCLSLSFAPPPRLSLEAAYALLCEPLDRAHRSFGMRVSHAAVPGAFCDGRFNLTAGSRKIAGTAQRWRARPGRGARGAVLAHATWLVDADLVSATAAVNRFQALAGGDARFAPEACTTLRTELMRRGDPRASLSRPALMAAAREALLEALGRGLPPLLATPEPELGAEASRGD